MQLTIQFDFQLKETSGKLRKSSKLLTQQRHCFLVEIHRRFPLDFQLVHVQLFAAHWISNRKTMFQHFQVGNSPEISFGFPFDFLTGKPRYAGSAGANRTILLVHR